MNNSAQKEKTKKAGIMYDFVIVLLILIIAASSCIGIFAWAKYTSATDGTATAQVAKWSFKLVDGVTQTTGVIDFAITRTDGYGKVVEGLLAPGTFGEFQIGIDARGTETILEYTIDVELENKPTYLKLYSDSEKTQEILVTDNKFTVEGYMSLEDVKEIRTETIYWDWPYENGDDVIDTADSGKTMTMKISVTGYEVIEPLLETTEWEFYYTGQVEEFIVPATGTYKLEVWGAQGGTNSSGEGGNGGYSYGNIYMSKDSPIYIVIGSQPTSTAGGYNGGGTGTSSYMGSGYGGGGATHIATSTGTLSELSEEQESVLIVAGGGGGGVCAIQDLTRYAIGGAGGGESGISGSSAGLGSGTAGTGATQTTGYLFGQGGNGTGKATTAYNSNTGYNQTKYGHAGGGGGGYYGGIGGTATGTSSIGNVGARVASGGGGSGYVGGVTDGNTITGDLEVPTYDGTGTMTGNTGDGYAKITWVSP